TLNRALAQGDFCLLALIFCHKNIPYTRRTQSLANRCKALCVPLLSHSI
ncbi:hypothetical protein BHU45_000847, partial [Salmonella enterica subsp. enterica serovar Hadar]|nr:hypothetical protein [Salmonella enterica subsp. enterica serovar Hadar]